MIEQLFQADGGRPVQHLLAHRRVALQVVAEQGVKDLDLGREVVEQSSGADAGPTADRRGRAAVHPVQGELHRRGLDDAGPLAGVLLRVDGAYDRDHTRY